MGARRNLIIGRYYWVIPAPEKDDSVPRQRGPQMGWHDEIQPSRFNGWSADGKMLWNFLGVDDSSTWPVLWIGAAIELPVSAMRARQPEGFSGRRRTR
jgi:hypothetical protein